MSAAELQEARDPHSSALALKAPTYAAVDVGTNNCRLLVARPVEGGFRVIDAFSRVVRLGEGLAASGILCESAMRRTLEALAVCAAKMRRRGVTTARAVATEACRRADNCGEFLDRARRTTGIRLEIISSAEEARLALDGCAPLLTSSAPYALVFDIGGGSSELNWLEVDAGKRTTLLGSVSMPHGVVTLSERHGSGRIGSSEYESMVAEVTAALEPFEARYRIGAKVADGLVQMLGTSGTVTTLAGVHLGLERYQRALIDGYTLDFGAIAAVSRQLADMDCTKRAMLPCIGPERADLVVAGCAILEAICRIWPVGRVRVADRGLREGILFRLMGRHSVEGRAGIPA
ncbi:MAG TPA: Ppx/GppA phosphatase family protein [Alphaproteobacteria bacterium]|nr:Ppx/GppA phosphatase family protein [Alphaproteobacteria bacterium]